MNFTLSDFDIVDRASQNHYYNIVLDSRKHRLFHFIKDISIEGAAELVRNHKNSHMKCTTFNKKFKSLFAGSILDKDVYVVFHSEEVMDILSTFGRNITPATYKREKYIKLNIDSVDKANYAISKLTKIFGKSIIKKVYYMNMDIKKAIAENFYYKTSFTYSRPTRFNYKLMADSNETLRYITDVSKDILKDTNITIFDGFDNTLSLNNITYKDLDSMLYLSGISNMQGRITLKMVSATVNLNDSTIESIEKIKQLNQLQIVGQWYKSIFY